jgi:5-methylcytosine-specific restriction protein A
VPRLDDNRPWRHLYDTARWRALRSAVLSERPLCVRCLSQGIVEPATVVHHETPHRGDLDLFWGGPFSPLCKPHHDSQGQLEDHGKVVIQFDENGWPI